MKRLAMALLKTALSCVVLVAAGGGFAFVSRPVGITFLALWAVWCLVTDLGIRPGALLPCNRKQQRVMALAVAAWTLQQNIISPWEYAHFTGPIPRDGLLAWIGLLLIVVGISLQLAAILALRGLYTIRQGIQPEHHLVLTGPYRLVRHPGYLSQLIHTIGLALALSSLIGLVGAVLIVIGIYWRIKREEEMLAIEFGEEYQIYIQRTQWRLVPLIY